MLVDGENDALHSGASPEQLIPNTILPEIAGNFISHKINTH
jgi:hypothetical protein